MQSISSRSNKKIDMSRVSQYVADFSISSPTLAWFLGRKNQRNQLNNSPFCMEQCNPFQGTIRYLSFGCGGWWVLVVARWNVPEPSKILAPTPGLLPNHTLNLAKICWSDIKMRNGMRKGRPGPGCSKLSYDNTGFVWNLISDLKPLKENSA